MIGRQRIFLPAALGLAVAFAVCALGVRVLRFRDRFVMITVEESSTAALTAWPLLAERLPDVFVDCAGETITVSRRPPLWGVCLGVHYSVTSQGIELSESMEFSRSGRTTVPLTMPVSVAEEQSGNVTGMLVDNGARVVAGDLRILRTSGDGTVRFAYGDRRFALRPGETWAEILVLEPRGVHAVNPGDWATELEECIQKGYPATRLAVANRGFWPKSGVREEVGP